MTLEEFLKEWHSTSERMLVHTSGSTGKPKPMWIEKRLMESSARITCDFLGLQEGDSALLCMPLDYIAGKMVAVRALVRGLSLVCAEPSGHPLRSLSSPVTFAAMVPMQVYNSLKVPAERKILNGIKHLIIGGGAIEDDLARDIESLDNTVWSSYGMTETLSHIALRRLNGSEKSDWYTPFDTVEVSLNAENCLVVNAPEVCRTVLITNDIAEIAPDNRRFRIIGRKDNVIVSGGVKIQIEEVERMLKPHFDEPYMITKRKDAKFGEAVVMLLQSENKDAARLVCENVLPKYWRPRFYISVGEIPKTETGKPNRAEAMRIAAE